MINVRDLDFKTLTRTRRVNGEKTIELDVLPTENNKDTFDLIVEEVSVKVLDDDYIIKKLNEKSIGKTYWKQSSAIHDFFVNLINKQQPRIHNGSITFNNYMQMVFEGTGYTFVVIDQFLARSFENLGNDNRLALLQKGLDRFKAEFELVGTEVRFKQQVGSDTDIQFRYGHNIKGIDKGADTTNLATKISGTGDPELGIKASYTSPNVAIFDEIDAPPVDDERFKTKESLLEEMKSRLQDSPEVSITVDFVDLRAAGYPYTVPNEGDRVWLIYEPMDDLLIEVRIMEIKEHFDVNLNPIRTEVTLSNYKKTFAGTMFDNIKKQLSEIVNDDGVIKYNALDEAVKIATEALHSAQTELEFNNGIIAREKDDPNRVVVLNSAGLGISKNGGNTFQEAITADGFVLSAGAIGRLSANNISVGVGTEFDPDYDPSEYAPIKDTVEKNKGIWDRSSAFDSSGNLNTDYLKGAIDVTKNKITQSSRFYWDADGLVAVDPTNSNKIVKYTSGGIGISTNGGRSYQTAMTADGIIGIDIIGTNIMSFNEVTNDVVTLENGEMETFKDGQKRFGIKGNGLEAYHWETEEVVATFRASHVNNEQYGAGIIAYGDYFSIGPNEDTSISLPQLRFGWAGDYDSAYLHGGSGKRDSGELELRSTKSGGTAAHRVPRMIIDNKTVNGNAYSGIRSYVGRDNRSPANSDFRSGFEVWQYKGDGKGGVDQLLKIDTNSNNESYIVANVDDFWVKGNYRTPGSIDIGGVLSVGEITAPTSSKRSIHLYDSNLDTGTSTVSGMTLENSEGNGGVFFGPTAGFLMGGLSHFGVIGVRSDSTSAFVQSITVFNRTYDNAPNLYVTSNGVLGRSTSSRRYKLNEKPIALDYARKMYDIDMKSWFSKRAVEEYAHELSNPNEKHDYEKLSIIRNPGFIAEDVHDIGLTMFVEYNEKDQPDAISNNLSMLAFPLLKEHENRLNEYDNRFGTVENRLDKLEKEMNKLKGVA